MKRCFSLTLYCAAFSLSAAILYQNPLDSASHMTDWQNADTGKFSGGGKTISRIWQGKDFAGRIIRAAIDIKPENIQLEKPDHRFGAKTLFTFDRTTGGRRWNDISGKAIAGTADWRRYERLLDIPDDAERVTVSLFLQGATGSADYRNFLLETGATPLDLSIAGNMAFADEKANDGQGGWFDGGPENDGRAFQRMLAGKQELRQCPIGIARR